MLTGPMQPEMGRMRDADRVRRAERNRSVAGLSTKRRDERRGRIGAALASAVASLRPAARRTPEPVRRAAVHIV
jgi:hypothetical protein